jgi:hypothetical protein
MRPLRYSINVIQAMVLWFLSSLKQSGALVQVVCNYRNGGGNGTEFSERTDDNQMSIVSGLDSSPILSPNYRARVTGCF